MKKLLKVGGIIISAVLLIYCLLSVHNANIEKDCVLKISFYRVATSSETYCFTLRSNNKLEISCGVRDYNKKVSSKYYLITVSEREEIGLSEQLQNELIILSKSIIESEKHNNDSEWTDEVGISIYYNGKVHSYCYNYTLGVLLDKLRSCTSMEIDLHGWA